MDAQNVNTALQPPLPTGLRRPFRATSLLAGAAVVLALLAVFLFDPERHSFFPLCIFHAATGLNCPGCGATRALHQLLHGHFAEALRFNALFVALLPTGIFFAARNGMARWSSSTRAAAGISPAQVWLLFALAVAFGVCRNLPAFAWLSP